MRSIVPAIIVLACSLSLQADTTGRIAGKVINKKGEALPQALVTIRRLDIKWSKEIKPSASGTFLQVGLEPKEFELRVSCKGYADYVEVVKIPLGDTLMKNVTLLTLDESAAASGVVKTPVDDPGVKAENEATEAFNKAVTLYNERKYQEAQPLLASAQAKFMESIEKTKDEEVKATLRVTLVKIDRVLGIVYGENFLAQPASVELAAKAVPLLEKALERKADDGQALQTLVSIGKARNDQELLKKYQPQLDKILGPRPELAYNDAVAAFNAGDMATAKANLKKAIAADPKFAESYYLLGMVEYGLNNLKGTKDAFLKYLEIAPTGKKAAEVKEMLNDPSLKRIK
jgi:ethanolamine utilization microcompartment shell protein EutL